MKNLLAFLGAAVLVFVGVGLYLNWFHIRPGQADAGHKAFNIDLNTKKIESDAEKGGEKAVDLIHEVEAKAKAEADKKAEAQRNAAAGVNTDGKTQESGKGEK
ncbi:MAG TPA: hypothetical protein VMS17_26825 [Gemmataceae bacterium]|nr:hypothetical protein [Gemmataceae bacterium]